MFVCAALAASAAVYAGCQAGPPNARLGLNAQGPQYGLQAVPSPKPTPSVPGTDTLAGTGKQGLVDGGTSVAAFQGPTGIAVDKTGTLYVSDSRNHCIRRVSAGGTVTTLAGTNVAPHNVDGPLAQAAFFQPAGLAMDAKGLLYISDRGNNKVRRVRVV